MPNLDTIAAALRQYSRYAALEMFADDAVEFCDRSILTNAELNATLVRRLPRPSWQFVFSTSLLTASLSPEQGIAQFRLSQKPSTSSVGITPSAEEWTALDSALTIASETAAREKQGLLGDLILGMMVGKHVGSPAGPVGQRILTITYDSVSAIWRAYDGPLLPWAKQHLALKTT